MSIHFNEASSFAAIDLQIEGDRHDLSPAQYEIVRRVIHHTGNLEYYSLLRFSEHALDKGLKALIEGFPIVVDVPEIQVSIVPKLQHLFHNPVYCCATTGTKIDDSKTKAAFGLEKVVQDRPDGVFIIGQDRGALNTLVELIKNKTVNPALAIATSPSLIEREAEEYLRDASVETIYLDNPKGDAIVASTIFNTLVDLAWRANKRSSAIANN